LRRDRHAEPEHEGVAKPEGEAGDEGDLGDIDDTESVGGIDPKADRAAGENRSAEIVTDGLARESGNVARRHRRDRRQHAPGIDVAQHPVQHEAGNAQHREACDKADPIPADPRMDKLRQAVPCMPHSRSGGLIREPHHVRGMRQISNEWIPPSVSKLRHVWSILSAFDSREISGGLMRVLVATDAWHPQVNGVVRTLSALQASAPRFGAEISFLTHQGLPSFPLPTYPDIRCALAAPWTVAQRIEAARPDAIHIATEGTIGHAVRRYCLRRDLPFTSSFHTRLADYVTARVPIPESWVWRWLRRFHGSRLKKISKPSCRSICPAARFWSATAR
jgi:hypothetical protein